MEPRASLACWSPPTRYGREMVQESEETALPHFVASVTTSLGWGGLICSYEDIPNIQTNEQREETLGKILMINAGLLCISNLL